MTTFKQFVAEAVETWYHGSDSAIDAFEYTDKQDAVHQEGPGIYLTSSKEDARRYGKYVHVVEAKVVKSRMMPDKRALKPEIVRFLINKAPDRDDVLTDWDENPAKALDKAVAAIMDRHGPNEYREAMESIWFDFYRGHERAWLERMSAAGMGWDGFILGRAEGIRHFICFNPKILRMVDREEHKDEGK